MTFRAVTSAPRAAHDLESDALEVAVERKRCGNLQRTHDGEADTVREAQASITQALVDIEGGLLQGPVRADNVDDPAGKEQAREANGPRGAEPRADQRDRLVEDMVGREEPES